MSATSLRRLVQTAVLLLLCLAVCACANKKINKSNYDKIADGMTLKEVRELLGEAGTKEEGDPSAGIAAQAGVHIEGEDSRKTPGSVYVWERGEVKITVYFDQNGRVNTKTQKGL
jgi:outer membrane protein assembly factor BamE (lipoprotein component of BamABCDE complex)